MNDLRADESIGYVTRMDPKTLACFTEIRNEITRRYEFVVNQLE